MDCEVYHNVCVKNGHSYQAIDAGSQVYVICVKCGHDVVGKEPIKQKGETEK